MYQVGFERFRTKADVASRFRQIVSKTRESHPVSSLYEPFLVDLFCALQIWPELSSNMKYMTVYANHRGFKFLFVMDRDGYTTRMSSKKAISLLLPFYGKPRGVSLPTDYVAAAKASISAELGAFLLEHRPIKQSQSTERESIINEACQVEYLPPWTFDNLLFQFTKSNLVNPTQAIVRSKTEELGVRLDDSTCEKWQDYHRKLAILIVTTGGGCNLANRRGKGLSRDESAWVDLLC